MLLVTPLVGGYLLVGATAAVGVAMGYLGCVAPALMLPRRQALGPSFLPAMTGAVAAAVNGQAFAAACFVAMACLLVAPANGSRNGLLAGVPTVAAVLTTVSSSFEPFEVSGWMLAANCTARV